MSLEEYKLAIVGSRLYPHREQVFGYVAHLPLRERAFKVVTGGAEGVDDWAQNACRQRNIPVKVLLPDAPDYDHFPPEMRPLKRNEDIVELCDGLVAFWGMDLAKTGKGSGTVHVMKIAYEVEKLIKIITPWGVLRPEGGCPKCGGAK